MSRDYFSPRRPRRFPPQVARNDNLVEDAAGWRIVETIFQALIEHGYSSTSSREVAKRAKVSKHKLYIIFSTNRASLPP